MTQKEKIIRYLMKHKKGMTNGDGMRILMINCPHKRIAELTSEWGIKIERDYIPDPYHKGHTLTRHRLVDRKQKALQDYLDSLKRSA